MFFWALFFTHAAAAYNNITHHLGVSVETKIVSLTHFVHKHYFEVKRIPAKRLSRPLFALAAQTATAVWRRHQPEFVVQQQTNFAIRHAKAHQSTCWRLRSTEVSAHTQERAEHSLSLY